MALLRRDSKDSSLEIDHLEIDRFDAQLGYCPLIQARNKRAYLLFL
jgi:hypothetical protein